VIRGRHALVLLLAAACTRGRTPQTTRGATRAEGPPVPLTVENRYRFDVNIFVMRTGSQRQRLGTVVAATTRDLQLPASYTDGGGLRLVADPIGPSAGSTLTSERVVLTRSVQRVVWSLESGLARSTIAVY
jgi:hypothetical protein